MSTVSAYRLPTGSELKLGKLKFAPVSSQNLVRTLATQI